MRCNAPLFMVRLYDCTLPEFLRSSEGWGSIAYALVGLSKLPIAYCLLPIAYCLLPTGYWLLPIGYCLLPIGYSYQRGVAGLGNNLVQGFRTLRELHWVEFTF
jgi:hypothetical protein